MFRDLNGIRPLLIGKYPLADGRNEYIVAFESIALDTLRFSFLRNIAANEAMYIRAKGSCLPGSAPRTPGYHPCRFEYVYFARPASFIDKILVYGARWRMGQMLGEKSAPQGEDFDIDVVIPIPETFCDIALEIARILNKPYRQGFMKNRYLVRTVIMPGQQVRR